jgi:hypothetical protein
MSHRPLTICLAYYENAGMLERHYTMLAGLSADLKTKIELVVVDDGSPDNPARPPSVKVGVSVCIYRILVDVRWNQDAARNLAVHKAVTEWLLLTDIDHLIPEATLRRCVYGKLDPRCAYNFSRVNDPALDTYHPHPNSWLMTKQLYDMAGGYDERFAGVYGTDGMFRGRVKELAANVAMLPEVLIRVPRSVTPDASTTRYLRKQPEDVMNKDRISREIAESGDRTPRRLTFPYERVC